MKALYTLLFSALFFVACGNTETSGNNQETKRINDVEVEEIVTLLETQPGVLLDVRTAGEVAQGYIEGAENIDITQPGFMDKVAKFDKNQPIYVYCKLGGRSANASEKLATAGFTKVYNLMGGFDAWKAAGNPVVK